MTKKEIMEVEGGFLVWLILAGVLALIAIGGMAGNVAYSPSGDIIGTLVGTATDGLPIIDPTGAPQEKKDDPTI